MEIEIINGENSDYMATLIIKVDGKERINVYPGEPEDSFLERDLSFAYDIVPLMEEAYNAGKNGQPFEITRKEEKDEE